jgi:hypothetical protein
VKKVQRTRWQDSGRENGTRGGRTVEAGAPRGSGNSGEESRSWRGGIGHDKAMACSGRVRETLQTKTRARDEAESASHLMDAANQRDRTPVRRNQLSQGGIERN